MDEPLSNLDALLRENMRGELKALFRRLGATVLYVTHDQGEAMSLSDDVLVLKDGKVRQSGPPLELYARPADVFVATFVGSPRMTIWKGAREGAFFVAPGVRLPLPEGVDDERELLAGFRPEDVAVSADPPDGGGGTDADLDGAVELVEPTGERTLLTVRVGGQTLRAFAAPRPWPDRVRVRIPGAKVHWFSAATEKRLA